MKRRTTSRRRPLPALIVLLPLLFSCSRGDVDLVGVVEHRIVELAAPRSEVIVEVPVSIGDTVAADQLLVQLDPEVAASELRAAEAAHRAASATLTAAEKELERFDRLRRSGVGTQQQLDQARRSRDEALAQAAEREARVAQARKGLEDLTIRSHLPGVVDQLPFDVGERVPTGGVVAVVLAGDRPWVRVWLPARAAASVRPGDAAAVSVQGLEGRLEGRVEEIARQPAFTPHYALTERESAHLVYETRVVLIEAPEGLRPGLAARVRLEPGGGES